LAVAVAAIMLELAQSLVGLVDLVAVAALTVYPIHLRAALELAVKGLLVVLAVAHLDTGPVVVVAQAQLAQMDRIR
jgi:hypothetical protein